MLNILDWKFSCLLRLNLRHKRLLRRIPTSASKFGKQTSEALMKSDTCNHRIGIARDANAVQGDRQIVHGPNVRLDIREKVAE